MHLYSYVTRVNLGFVSVKIIDNIDNFGIKCLSYGKISAILCSLLSVFTNLLRFLTSCIIGPLLLPPTVTHHIHIDLTTERNRGVYF